MRNGIIFLMAFVITVSLLGAVFSQEARAAYNDTTLEAGTIFYIAGVAATTGASAGINISVAADSEVVSVEVGSDSLTVEMEAGSKIYLSSGDRKTFINSTESTSCSNDDARFSHVASDSETLTITFADANNCAAVSRGGGAAIWRDTSAPTISAVEVSVGRKEATIGWRTSEPALTWLTYGTSTIDALEIKTAIYKTNHLVVADNLEPNATYHYQIKARDGSGNESVYSEQIFATLNEGGAILTGNQENGSSNGNQNNFNNSPDDGLSGIKADMKLAKKLMGRLLLRVEKGGEIWYVDTKEYKRYEVKFANALYVFQKLALGISNADLGKIPVSGSSESGNVSLRNKLKGKLLLAVEDHGRIWYADKDGYRHEVTWNNLMDLFRKLALGITDANLGKIPAGTLN